MSATPPPTAAQNAAYLMPRDEWLARRREAILEPGLPIIDPHHPRTPSQQRRWRTGAADGRRPQRGGSADGSRAALQA